MLLVAEGDLSDSELKELQATLDRRLGRTKLIAVPGNRRAVIVRTTGESVPSLRAPATPIAVGGKTIVSVLTSGAVGNLKRRASDAGALG